MTFVVGVFSTFMSKEFTTESGRIAFSSLFSFGGIKLCNPIRQHGRLCLTEVGWQFCVASQQVLYFS